MQNKISATSPELWNKLKDNTILLDSFIEIFVYNKDDENILKELKILLPTLTELEYQQLLEITVPSKYQKPLHLSRKAIELILPYMKKGETYIDAVTHAIPEGNRARSVGRAMLLPALTKEDIRNPVVLRSVSQARKLVNEIIRVYGSPTYVHIELAREMVKNHKDRAVEEKRQKENQAKTALEVAELIETYKIATPNGGDILKYRLWKQQDGKCAYTMKTIPAEKLFSDPTFTQIDHIFPFSRSLDDSVSNKVLVLSEENQNKKNKTPYEYIASTDVKRWEMLNVWWSRLYIPARKLQKLLAKDFSDIRPVDFIARDLNDTRYISKFLKNYVENQLEFMHHEKAMKTRVFTYNGIFTAVLRKRWGFTKQRELNNRHHALDATVVALGDLSMLQRISSFAKKQEDRSWIRDLKHDEKFPTPWNHFRTDVINRIMEDDPLIAIKSDKELAENYSKWGVAPRPLFVSHMVDKKVTGAAHTESVYGLRIIDAKPNLVIKKSIGTLTKAHFDKKQLFLQDDPATEKALRERLEQFDWDTQKAFAEPVYKIGKNGGKTQIKSVKVISGPANSFVPVNHGKGVSLNDSMVRVDVFAKNGKFYLIPIYIADTTKKELPNRAITAHKPESEWDIVDGTYKFAFSLFHNDYVKVTLSSGAVEGYYVGAHRGTGAIKLRIHDGSKGEIATGVKLAKAVEKFAVDYLGNRSEILQETRHGF